MVINELLKKNKKTTSHFRSSLRIILLLQSPNLSNSEVILIHNYLPYGTRYLINRLLLFRQDFNQFIYTKVCKHD